MGENMGQRKPVSWHILRIERNLSEGKLIHQNQIPGEECIRALISLSLFPES